MLTRPSTTTSALHFQRRRPGLIARLSQGIVPWTRGYRRLSSTLRREGTSQEIDYRSRAAAIDPESLRDRAYAPRHPIDLAPQHELALALEPFSDVRMDVESAPGNA